MPSFSSIVSGMKTAAMQPITQVGINVKAAAEYGKAAVYSRSQAAVAKGVQSGVNGVLGAATQAITGDFSGAADSLGKLPGAMLNKALGINDPLPGGPLYLADSEYSPMTGINSRADALLNYNWFASFPMLGSQKTLDWFYCETAALTWRTIDTGQVYRRGHQETVPKGYSVAPLRLGLMLDNSNAVMDYLSYWNSLVLQQFDGSTHSQGNWGRPAEYQKTLTFNVLSVNKQRVMTITYHDVWPTNLEALSLVSNSSERLIAEVEFAVNDVSYYFQPAAEVTGVFEGNYPTGPAYGDVTSVTKAVVSTVGGYLTKGLSSVSPTLARGINNILGF